MIFCAESSAACARRILLALPFCLAASLFASACGPIGSAFSLHQAHYALEEAREAEAEEFAPYEFHAAQLYLEKARATDASAHYSGSVHFAEEAHRKALKALDNAPSNKIKMLMARKIAEKQAEQLEEAKRRANIHSPLDDGVDPVKKAKKTAKDQAAAAPSTDAPESGDAKP